MDEIYIAQENSKFNEYVVIYFEDVKCRGLVNIYSPLFKEIVQRCTDDFELQMMNIKVT
jgi:hypothetical protein